MEKTKQDGQHAWIFAEWWIVKFLSSYLCLNRALGKSFQSRLKNSLWLPTLLAGLRAALPFEHQVHRSLSCSESLPLWTEQVRALCTWCVYQPRRDWIGQSIKAPWLAWFIYLPILNSAFCTFLNPRPFHLNFPLTHIKQCEKIPVASVLLLQWGLGGWVTPLFPCLPACLQDTLLRQGFCFLRLWFTRWTRAGKSWVSISLGYRVKWPMHGWLLLPREQMKALRLPDTTVPRLLMIS